MKKVILLMLLAFSLSAEELMCDDAYERFVKYSQQFDFAFERNDLRVALIASGQRLFYIEKIITACGVHWKHREQALVVRESVLDVDNTLRAYLDQ